MPGKAVFDAPSPVPPQPGERHSRVFTTTRVENMIARVLAVAVIVFGVQAAIFAMMMPPVRPPMATTVYRACMFAPLVIVAVAGLLKRGVRPASAVFAFVYLAALIVWPIYTRFVFGGAPDEPWIWYLLTVATACAAVAFPVVWAVAYTIGVPVLFGVVRTLAPDGLRGIESGILDAIYGAIFGMVIVLLTKMFRQSARRVDAARDAALARYDRAVRAHAMEAERVEVDALVHDNVLAALQAAERAVNAEGERAAVQIAEHALAELREAGVEPADDESTVTLREMASRLSIASRMMDRGFDVSSETEAGAVVPQSVANAMGLAAVQAMVNSVEHAEGQGIDAEAAAVHRSITVTNDGTAASIVITDDGVGFDPDSVPDDRLGLRVSIRERMVAVGGEARVHSVPGDGTEIELTWCPEEVDE